MTKAERGKIETAIKHLMSDDHQGWDWAMRILCPMVGLQWAGHTIPDRIPVVEFDEFLHGDKR